MFRSESLVSLEETIYTESYLCVNWNYLSFLQYKCKAKKGEKFWYQKKEHNKQKLKDSILFLLTDHCKNHTSS